MIRPAVNFCAALLVAACTCCRGVAEELPVLPLQRLSLPQDLLTVKPPAITNQPVWKSSVALGFTITKGNSDTMLAIANLQTSRRAKANEWLFGADGAYGEDNSVKNRDTLHGFGQFNHFFTDRLFVFGRLDGLHDGIKDIKYRLSASTGLGYYVVQRTNTSLVFEAGPSLVSERQGDKTDTYSALRLAERFDQRLNAAARLWQSAELIPQVDQTANFIVNAEVGIETVITKELSLRVSVQDNYVNEPAATYKNNDFRLISGLSYKF